MLKFNTPSSAEDRKTEAQREGITDDYLEQFILLLPAGKTPKRKAQPSDSNSISRNLTGCYNL